jgi:hypothetical protein
MVELHTFVELPAFAPIWLQLPELFAIALHSLFASAIRSSLLPVPFS